MYLPYNRGDICCSDSFASFGDRPCTAAFRIIDALLLRPLPVRDPQRLYVLKFQGIFFDGIDQADDVCMYPMFRILLAAVKDKAEAVAISFAERGDLTYGSDQDMETEYFQYVSGWMFSSFVLQPAALVPVIRAVRIHPMTMLRAE